ncbi:820fc4df-60b8-4ee9-b06e-d296b2d27425 [Thermothielavioides terrestris]|uniref:CID domain-containing protein n=2 Tax=Thermothielavioides terrestris TaxID=2587410 RepID=G2R8Z4_THETT|nr:uncharacterized protein THITE_2080526 [Thermothielavioides terrestris NRRL 8126]AEO69444.1 hypothetical protein THITE_2080526 [Thermothielavioides terrestris NRRL 8126]SPQ25957.1 820fc4df-60b8-4ee9-b06e-d296b2d27425 [Thermothielavioides terrestris]
MADPFEVRMRFTSQLRQLNASVTSAQKAAQYALKYRDMAEDLHSCILEQLERNNMNTRANIMYFIEHFLDMANKDGHVDYVRMMQRDIIRVVDAVAPDDGSGAANVKVVRKVLHAMQSKSFLDAQVVTQIEEVLRDRDVAAQDIAMSSPPADHADGGDGADGLGDMPPSRTLPPYHGKGGSGGPPKLDKKQIEQRMEEDRERHKRQRENIWAVPPGEDAEMEKLWEETSDLGEDDHRMGEEELAEWRAEFEARKCVHQREGADGLK